MADKNHVELPSAATPSPTADAVYRLLRHPDRRFVLYYLLAVDRVPLEELADVVTGWMAVAEGRVATPDDRTRVLASLVHGQLPELAEAGFLSVQSGTVSRCPLPTDVRSILEESLVYESAVVPEDGEEPVFAVGGGGDDDDDVAEADDDRDSERKATTEGQSREPLSFAEAIAAVEARRIQVTVYSADTGGGVTETVREQFGTKNATVTHRPLPGESELAFLVFATADGFAGAMSARRFQAFLTPPIYRPWDDEFVHAGYRVLFALIDDTLFTSMDRRQLLAATREIEDRAWRVGTGTLHVCFQSSAKLRAQRPLFERLCAETDLEIHCYMQDRWEGPEIDGLEFHVSEHPDVSRHWALVYDGGGEPLYACAMVAREIDEGDTTHRDTTHADVHFDGFWTYDPTVVAELGAHLESVGDRE